MMQSVEKNMSNAFIFLIISLFVGVIDVCAIEFSFRNDKHYSIGWITVAFILTLQRLKHIGFLCTFTSSYTRKHRRLMSFHKTFTAKDTSVSISDSIRLVSKPKADLLFVFIRTLNILH